MVGLAKVWRWVFAGGLVSIVLALALRPAPAPQTLADAPQKVSEWIVLVANSDEQMANLISNRVLNDMVNNPYQQQLDSLSNEFESALDFTLRMMPIELELGSNGFRVSPITGMTGIHCFDRSMVSRSSFSDK